MPSLRRTLRGLVARASLLVRACVALAMQSWLVVVLAAVLVLVGALFLLAIVGFVAPLLPPAVTGPFDAPAVQLAGILGAGVLFAVAWAWGVRYELGLTRRRVLSGTREADPEGDAAFVSTATRLAAQVDQPLPELYVRETDLPLCLTLRGADGPVLVVSTGLRDRLSSDAFEAVLAHEFGHLANADHRLMTWAVGPLFAAEEFAAPFEEDAGDPRIWPWLALTRSTVLWGRLAVGLFSRGRERAADRAAVAITGDPAALADALEALSAASHDAPEGHELPETDLREHAHGVDALSVLPTLDPTTDGRGGLLATHPATEERIARLRRLAAGG